MAWTPNDACSVTLGFTAAKAGDSHNWQGRQFNESFSPATRRPGLLLRAPVMPPPGECTGGVSLRRTGECIDEDLNRLSGFICKTLASRKIYRTVNWFPVSRVYSNAIKEIL